MKQFFDTLTMIIRAASPSIYAFIETTLPYSSPAPIAIISSASAATFFGLKGLGAFLFVYSLEGIGLISTSKLVEHIVIFIRSRNVKTAITIAVLTITVIVYITILVSLNVRIHEEFTDDNFKQALTLICYLPLIAGILNGLTLVKTEDVNAAELKNKLAEEHYQQNRSDRLKLKALDKGVNLFQTTTVPVPEVSKSKGKTPGDYRDYVLELLDKHGELPLTEITALVNKNKRVEFVHADVKGTWYKYVQIWKRGRQ